MICRTKIVVRTKDLITVKQIAETDSAQTNLKVPSEFAFPPTHKEFNRFIKFLKRLNSLLPLANLTSSVLATNKPF
jgi:hypothetical protein